MTARTVIGIDASRAFVAQRTGTETYSFQLLQALARRRPPWRYRAYVNAACADPVGLDESLEIRPIPFPRFWTHGRLSVEMARHRPDLLFVPAHVIPLLHPPSVVTVHDLGYLHVPEAHPPRQRRMLDLTTRWSARVARRIIVPSAATARDLTSHLGIDGDMVTVVPHGVSPAFTPAPDGEMGRIRMTYGLRRPYVLAVGTIQPRKNYGRLAEAVRHMRNEDRDLDLVVVGQPGWLAASVRTEMEAAGLGDRLRLLGFVPPADLPALYTAASVFALVSRYEGFGLPALEAMACGTPVVIASGSSLPEIAGDAGIVVNPLAVDEIAGAIRSLLDDEPAHRHRAAAGLERARAFTWDRAAALTEGVFRAALGSSGPDTLEPSRQAAR